MTANPSCASLPGGLCLTYLLPGVIHFDNGDVAISDSATALVLGDGLRFTDATGDLTGTTADRMIYFSDLDNENDGALADTGFPTNFSTTQNPSFTALEVGPEGANSFTVKIFDTTFNGISDGSAVPEPATVVLLGSSALAMALARRLRRTS
jgi:hypothetical protein